MFAVLQLPNFHLQAALRQEPGALNGPAVLLDEDPLVKRSRDRIRITQLARAATDAGVEAGMTATQGQARCPGLRIVTRSTPAEQAAQEILLQWAGSISPRIESTGDGLCTIDLTGTRFDREPALLGDRAGDAFTRLNLIVQVGIAANPELAFLAARFADNRFLDGEHICTSAAPSPGLELREQVAAYTPGPVSGSSAAQLEFGNRSFPRAGQPACTGSPAGERPANRQPATAAVRIVTPTAGAAAVFLAPLPVEALSVPAEISTVLRAWGVRTLGELVALPREGVVERLGPELLPLWRQLGGGEPRPLRLHRPAEVLTEAMDFEHHVERLDALLFVLNRFLHSLEVRLAEMYLVAESLTLELRFENGAPHERLFRIPEPTRDTDLLLRTLHTHLEGFRADAPIVGVRLTAVPARQPRQQLDLFQPSLRDPNRFAETLSRLEALLGTGRVGSPEHLPTHRPDAFRVVPFDPPADGALPGTRQPAVRFGPTLRRFRPPLPATVELRRELDAETLLRLSAGEVRGPIRASRGPWLASGDWWDRHVWERREWDIELADGGLYRVAEQQGRWQLDGEYD